MVKDTQLHAVRDEVRRYVPSRGNVLAVRVVCTLWLGAWVALLFVVPPDRVPITTGVAAVFVAPVAFLWRILLAPWTLYVEMTPDWIHERGERRARWEEIDRLQAYGATVDVFDKDNIVVAQLRSHLDDLSGAVATALTRYRASGGSLPDRFCNPPRSPWVDWSLVAYLFGSAGAVLWFGPWPVGLFYLAVTGYAGWAVLDARRNRWRELRFTVTGIQIEGETREDHVPYHRIRGVRLVLGNWGGLIRLLLKDSADEIVLPMRSPELIKVYEKVCQHVGPEAG